MVSLRSFWGVVVWCWLLRRVNFGIVCLVRMGSVVSIFCICSSSRRGVVVFRLILCVIRWSCVGFLRRVVCVSMVRSVSLCMVFMSCVVLFGILSIR